jgi:4-hydroxy-3-methylbut-2-enyl diphosphate reductase
MVINLYISNPRGFCAGVTNAINASWEIFQYIEERPIYFYHEIVHNHYLTKQLINKGAIFVNNISLVPNDSYVIFSAHGVSDEIEKIANEKNLKAIDLTCPLVHKVHREIQAYQKDGLDIIYIGSRNHQETKGTLGRLNESKFYVVEEEYDVETIHPIQTEKLAYISQTTLNVDKVKKIVEKIKKRFPNVTGADVDSICHATKNRQNGLKNILDNYKIDLVLTIGSDISSNSNKLAEIGKKYNINSYLIEDKNHIKPDWISENINIALTAGASAPEILINETIEYFEKNFNAKIHNVVFTEENVIFHPPKLFRELKKKFLQENQQIQTNN